MQLNLTNLKYANAEHTAINMTVRVDGGDPMPYTFVDVDDAPVAQAIKATMASTQFTIAEYVPPAPPAPVPVTVVSPRQIRLALNQMGLRSAVEAYVAAQGQDVQDSWAFTTAFSRTHPLLLGAAAALGKTDADIDALFTLAASL